MIQSFECCELAARLLGMGDDWEDEDEVWEKLYDLHEIGGDGFCWLVNQLLPMIDIAESPMTGDTYKGFSKVLKPGLSEWLVKMECPEFKEKTNQIAMKYLIDGVQEGSNEYSMEIGKADPREKYRVTVARITNAET